jgi:sugar phosphate isomerase/epimerase
VDHYLRKAADFKLEALFLCDPRHLDTLEYGHVSTLREKADSLGIGVELGTGGTNPDHLQNLVRAAHVVGSPVVHTTVDAPRPTSAHELDDMLSAAARNLRGVLPVCERYGVSLAVENTAQITCSELLALVEMVGSDWVGVCLDTGNPLAVLEDPLATAEALAPLTKAVHLKDCQVAARPDGFVLGGCALGEGVVDLGGILGALSSLPPDTSLSIEVALGRQQVPALSEEHLARFPGASARALGRALRLVRDRGLPHLPRLPTESRASEDEVLAEEDGLVLRSVEWARRALGIRTGE